MTRPTRWLPSCALALVTITTGSLGCARETPFKTEAISPAGQAAEQAVPPEIAAVATAALGRSARVVAFGDLAHNGKQQVLAADRTTVAAGNEPGVRFTRAAVLEQAGAKWAEVLRCDEYLKNPNGYLGGISLEPVTSWRLEWGQQKSDRGRALLFTPLRKSGAATLTTVSVRWNPATRRYQSFDPKSGSFFDEVPSLGIPVAPLR